MTAKSEPKAAAPEAASPADILIQMQLEEKRKKSINAMAVTEREDLNGKEKNEAGVSIVSRVTYANGSVVENYA